MEDPATAPLKARRRTSAKTTAASGEHGDATQEHETGPKEYSENANFGKIPAVWPLHSSARYPVNRRSLSDRWLMELPHSWEEWESYYSRAAIEQALATATLLKLRDTLVTEKIGPAYVIRGS